MSGYLTGLPQACSADVLTTAGGSLLKPLTAYLALATPPQINPSAGFRLRTPRRRLGHTTVASSLVRRFKAAPTSGQLAEGRAVRTDVWWCR